MLPINISHPPLLFLQPQNWSKVGLTGQINDLARHPSKNRPRSQVDCWVSKDIVFVELMGGIFDCELRCQNQKMHSYPSYGIPTTNEPWCATQEGCNRHTTNVYDNIEIEPWPIIGAEIMIACSVGRGGLLCQRRRRGRAAPSTISVLVGT